MHRIDTEGNVANEFSDGNPGIGQPATVVDASWLNDLQENVCQFIESVPVTLVKGTFTQLTTAISAVIAAAITALKAATNTWTSKQTFSGGVGATTADSLTTAGALTVTGSAALPSPALTTIGPPAGWTTAVADPVLSVYKDAHGNVHLEGSIFHNGSDGGSSAISLPTVPAGFRPLHATVLLPALFFHNAGTTAGPGYVTIDTAGGAIAGTSDGSTLWGEMHVYGMFNPNLPHG